MNEISYTANPKIGFPHYKGFVFKSPYGWKDRGEVGAVVDKDGDLSTLIHRFCRTRLRVGIENSENFRFCPKCLVKMVD